MNDREIMSRFLYEETPEEIAQAMLGFQAETDADRTALAHCEDLVLEVLLKPFDAFIDDYYAENEIIQDFIDGKKPKDIARDMIGKVPETDKDKKRIAELYEIVLETIRTRLIEIDGSSLY